MMIDLPYVQSRKNHYRYRRKVPAALRDVMGQAEIVIPLGKTEAEVIKRWPRADREAEKRLADAARAAENPRREKLSAAHRTPLERYKWANDHIAGLGLDPDWSGQGDPEDAEAIARDVIAESIAAKYPQDAEGYAQGVSGTDKALLRVLAMGAAAKTPEATLEDARKFYLTEKVKGTHDEVKKTQRVDRAVEHIRNALGRDPAISSLTRADAREVRDHMLKDAEMKPATVHRYMNDIRAVINHAIEKLPLPGVQNPFNKLEVKNDSVAKEERKPFTPEQLKKTRGRVLAHASEDLKLIWGLLEGTGCRLSEVAGLLVTDVILGHKHPHINLVFHSHRRLKNAGSIRKVPLIGDALKAAQEAVEMAAAGDKPTGPFLFSRYAATSKERLASSAALMKHVRKIVTDEKVTVHSLRHSLKDRLRLAGVEPGTIDDILGHSSGKVSERYGGDEARLEVTTVAMKKVFI
ncbi:tyrosine-type recombinase/integrase [Sinorhizobium meliloti]|nr:tyrosine-type recombinase/integrase [Sinorhizobium meliloti]